MKYNYHDDYLKYPIGPEPYSFDDGSTIQVHNIMDETPEFMKQADLMFVDPPWNKGNLTCFYTKAERDDYLSSYEQFFNRLLEVIKEINPETLYLEVGKEYLAEYLIALKKMYKHVTFYNSMYYHNPQNMCYVIRCSKSSRKPKEKLDGMDEEDIIKWVTANESYKCIADCCIGQGLVGYYANQAGHKFVGTELNHKRLSVLIRRIKEQKL